jgi:ATP-binding cassette, subfamily B, multidrug efflux pump
LVLHRLLHTYLRPYTRPTLGVLFLQLAATAASLYLPVLSADIIDEGIAQGNVGRVVSFGGWMVGLTLVQIMCSIAAVYLGAHIAMSFGRDLRSAVFRRVGEFSSRDVARFGAASLITRNTNDVQQVQGFVMMASMMITGPVIILGGIIMALREDIGLSWVMLVSAPAIFASTGLITGRILPEFQQMQGRLDTVSRVLRDQISGVRVVRAFVREPFEIERFGRANADLSRTALRIGRLTALILPIAMLILNSSSVAALWFGAQRVEAGRTQIGALTAYLNYLAQILMVVMIGTSMLIILPRAAACARRIQEVLDTEPSVAPPVVPVTLVSARGELELRNVTFQYPGAEAPVLRGVSFRVGPGTTTAVVGSAGAGKTTLVSLIPRLLDVTGGAVLVDGIDVRRLDPELLWARIGLVPQRPYLFTGTVATNLRYGRPDASDEELWEALEIAQARDFVEHMSDGLHAQIAQGGTNVSGGQRQRLAIARAVVRRPEIYLFDDSFSALDLGTDARLRAALQPVTANAAVVVVGQRIATVMTADQIIVLDNGAVVGTGRHEDLLHACPTYAEIVDSQLVEQPAAYAQTAPSQQVSSRAS